MSEMKRYRSQFNTYAPSDDGNWVKFSDAEAALAEKDARIKEIEELVEKLSCQLSNALRARRRED